jgi:hypothetical protein
MWLPSNLPADSVYWSWDEGDSHSSCQVGGAHAICLFPARNPVFWLICRVDKLLVILCAERFALQLDKLGGMTVHALTTSPNRDGLRFHLLSSVSSAGAAVNYVTVVDFTSLASLKVVVVVVVVELCLDFCLEVW